VWAVRCVHCRSNIPDDGCSMFHRKVHTCTKLCRVTPLEANCFVHWCENLKFWLWNCSCRITQIIKYGLLLIQETWQQKMQITEWAQPAVLRYTLRNNIARAIFLHVWEASPEAEIQEGQLPDYTALGSKSQQQWRNLVFCRPGWVITMAALNKNYEHKKSVIIECRIFFFLI
jgi:hypothetical protein